MFYAQLLLSKKGALGVVWLAAHCHKMLNKEQVQQTNISASVDRILIDEAHIFTYRILAFLLLGVVRIYSKKVEYLLMDCLEIVNKLNGVETPRSKKRSIRLLPSNYKSIVLPVRFELDEFDLELPENQDLGSGNLRSHKKAKLSGGRQKESDTHGLSKDKMPGSAPASSYTPLKEILSPHSALRDVFASAFTKSRISVSVSDSHYKSSFFLEEERLEPMYLDEETHHEASYEIAREPVFNMDDERMDPLLLDDEENELITNGKFSRIDKSNSHRSTTEVEYMESPSLQRSYPVSSSGILEKGIISSDHSQENLRLVETPVVELPEAGDATEEASVSNTPATNELRKISGKGKSSIDRTSVVSKKVYTNWLADTSSIKRRRTIVPDTLLREWRSCKLSHIPETVLELVIRTDSVVKLGSLGIIKSPILVTEPMETSANREIGHGDFGEIMDVRVPHEPSIQLDASRSEDVVLQPASSFDSHGRLSDDSLAEEESVSLEGNGAARKATGVFSARTRIIGNYLSRKFLDKKKRDDEAALNMSQFLEGRTKNESARLFYEILVLKSHDCINVKQDNAYNDILLRETPKLMHLSKM